LEVLEVGNVEVGNVEADKSSKNRSALQNFFSSSWRHLRSPAQGCQMAYLQTKSPNLEQKMLVYSTSIWNILRPFGTFYGHLVCCMAIWYIIWPFCKLVSI
jgi:hypothetical protein